jgi:endonuclease/exonuclease/phosphatase family metal-dependent hydrolase
MFRPPYVGHFRCRSRYPQEAFSFVLMNVHTSPQQTAVEFRALEEIVANVMRDHSFEDDFILLGDMNEEPGKFLSYRWMHNQYAAILSHWKTNTAETKNYDNIIFDHRRTAEFTGEAGVLNLRTYYQLTREQADRVSDHMPVWALFSAREVISGEITRQPATIR